MCEGDLNENDFFNEGNQSCLVTQFCVGAILTKTALLEMENHSWLQTFAWGDIDGNERFKMRNYLFDLLGSKD